MMRLRTLLAAAVLFAAVESRGGGKCRDKDMNCAVWVATDREQCDSAQLVQKSCDRSCGVCGEDIEPKFDVRKMPKELVPLAWLVGRWRSEFGGKAFFPTIPKFTYGEQINFEIVNNSSRPLLNYTAFAWDINMPDGDPTEIHSENGYLSIEKDGTVTLTTSMSNGFMTVEVGDVGQNQIKFSLQRIGRISFSHDSAVRSMYRDWTMLDERRLEARLLMTTTLPFQSVVFALPELEEWFWIPLHDVYHASRDQLVRRRETIQHQLQFD